MYKHMINWELVIRDQAGYTPKGPEDIFYMEHVSNDVLIAIKGDRSQEPLYVPYCPYKVIPVYGF